MKVTVTKEHLDRALEETSRVPLGVEYCKSCLIAQALKDVGCEEPLVDYGCVRIGAYPEVIKIDLSPAIQKLIRRFDFCETEARFNRRGGQKNQDGSPYVGMAYKDMVAMLPISFEFNPFK